MPWRGGSDAEASGSPPEVEEPLLYSAGATQEGDQSVYDVSDSYHPGDSTLALTSLHCKGEGYRHALLSATATLGLGCLGSSVLPMPYAFAKTGLLFGFVFMGIVAFANAFTAKMLLHSAAATHTDTYEACAEAVGGRAWKAAVQVTLLALLFGNTCGSVSLLGDVGKLMLENFEEVPWWIGARSGVGIQMLLLVFLVLPLCLLRDIRSLDQCAPFAVLVVLSLIAVIVTSSISEGLPAVTSGDLPIWIPAEMKSLPEAISLLGFAFYLHPCLIPVLREMPPGRLGFRATLAATQIVLYVICILVYGIVGFFGAARFGAGTKGDVLENQIVTGKMATILISATAGYLAISIPPTFYVLRTSFSQLVGADDEFSWVRHTVQTVGLLGAAMMVTLVFGNRAEKMFAITGATGVCMACYVLPIALCHLEQHKKMSRWRRLGAEESSKPVRISVFDNIMSVLILLIGGSTSAFALWTSLFGTS